ncbi:hypothetical protein [Prosthecomicrobium sp. N25]|uniref:hypothetical protein n=1 Tax=Prosthecomicrobium sp. N25 TaxID=3129254 RepID=UPI003078331E
MDRDWRAEIRSELRRENWSLRGVNRVVKVVPLDRGPQDDVGGYITLARFLSGLTPAEIETSLGLPDRFLASGAALYGLRRLPNPTEYTYELTAKHPDGLAYNPAHGDPRYGPGSDAIQQWQIRDGARIPFDPTSVVRLLPGQRFVP